MADRKILRPVRQGGKTFGVKSTKEQMDELESMLTKDDVERLIENEVLAGDWSGKRKSDQTVPIARRQAKAGPARPLGVRSGAQTARKTSEKKEKDETKPPAGGETNPPASGEGGAAGQPWAKGQAGGDQK